MRVYEAMVAALARELGVFELVQGVASPRGQWVQYFQRAEVEVALSMVEVASRMMEAHACHPGYVGHGDAKARVRAGIDEINTRFQEHGCGYQFVASEILRIDSQLIHAEVVKPALLLLQGSDYKGAHDEFLNAHEHYRHGNAKAALAEALKSLESVLKAICQKRGWQVSDRATIKPLIAAAYDNGLFPSYWESHFTALRSTLESGVPTARNREGGHGQGTEAKTVPQHLAAYVLHQAAAAIVYLIECEKALGPA